jgi:hypothetical protein
MSLPEDEWVTSLADAMSSTSPFSQTTGSTKISGSGASGVTLLSGESQRGAKRTTLFFFSPAAMRLCFGFVGNGGRRFCIKPIKEGSSTCGVLKHSSKFEPVLRHFYFRGLDSTAFCEPCYSEDIVPQEYRANILSTAKSIDEWKQVFSDYEEDAIGTTLPSREAPTPFVFPDPMKLTLKTPKKPSFQAETLNPPRDSVVVIPPEVDAIKSQAFLPARSHWWSEDVDDTIMSSAMFSFLTNLRLFMTKFDDWLVEPLDALSKCASSVEEDLHTLKLHCAGLQSALGRPISIADNEFPDVWCAIEFLSSSIVNEVSLTSVHGTLQTAELYLTSLHSHVEQLAHDTVRDLDQLAGIKECLAKYDNRFKAIHPMLTLVKDIGGRLDTLEKSFASLATPPSNSMAPDPWMMHLSSTSHPSSSGARIVTPVSSPRMEAPQDHTARLATLENTVQSLEKRIVGDRIRIGRFLFQSKEDLRVWLLAHVPGNRFGLFLDGVSVFDFLAQPHMGTQENMAHLYNSQKNGFDTVYESRIISSMQNLFPNLFGKSSADGMDTSRTLPGLQSPDKWNSNGVTGLQLQVERELPNVDLQFWNAIAAVFEDSTDARDLALELLYRSKKFALDLCNFIQRDFDFWCNKRYTKKEAWELTCLSVRRIFEDIHVVRVVGRDSRDLKNPALTATQVPWATLRAHLVMDEYSRRNFFEHPSISAVITRHLASHHTRPDATIELKVKLMDEWLVTLSNKVDSLESRIARLEEKNGIPPPKKNKGGGKGKNGGKFNAHLHPEDGGDGN